MDKYIYLSCTHHSSPPGVLAWPPWAAASNISVSRVSVTWNCSWLPSCRRACFPKSMTGPTAASASLVCGAPSLAFSIRCSTPTALAARLCAKSKRCSHSITKAALTKTPAPIARGFCSYVLLALLLLLRGVPSVFRLHHSRPSDLRKGKRLGKNDRLMLWRKPWPWQRPRYLPKALWNPIPKELSVRVVRFILEVP